MKSFVKSLLPYGLKNSIKKLIKKNYFCPVCNHQIKQFNYIGGFAPVLKEKQIIGGGRRKESCPHCQSSDRERLIYLYLFNEENISEKNIQILHIAPENNLGKILHQNFKENYFAGDLFTEGYDYYPEFVKNMNVLELPFEDDNFDLIICNHVLEHVPEDMKALDELYRVLKPGGKAVLQVPISANSKSTFEDLSVTDPEQREKLFCQFDHVRLYGQDYPERLKKAGYKVERINISKKYRKFKLNPKEDIFIGIKPI